MLVLPPYKLIDVHNENLEFTSVFNTDSEYVVFLMPPELQIGLLFKLLYNLNLQPKIEQNHIVFGALELFLK